MQTRSFGQTGLRVTPLGFGAMHLNDDRVSEAEAGRMLNAVLDAGVNLIDTARGYGLSEERIGWHLAHRRQEFVLSTKVGYGIPGVPDWTAACILVGVDAALARLRCEQLDIVHLHSCDLPLLQAGEVLGALGIAASVQPVHLRSDAEQQRLGWGRRSENTFPLRTFIETGALIPFGTDAPVEPPDPWPGIAVAVARRDPFDASALPTGVDQAISVERAIRAACLDPALVAGRADLGRLRAGCVADLIVVADVVARENPDIEELASVRPIATMIDGEVVVGGL